MAAPIHIMRWAPADYENDPFVMLMKKRDNTRVLAFYSSFLFRSHMAGGSLPADLELLSASLQLCLRTTKAGLTACLAHGKLQLTGDRVSHKRVVSGISKELEYREKQSAAGKRGGRPPKATLSEPDNPPSPLPAPTPVPTPVPLAETPKRPVALAPLRQENSKPETWNQHACRVVIERYGGTAPGGRITKALRPLVVKHGEQAVLAAWVRYLDETEAEYLSPERFATTFAHWSGGKAPPKFTAGKSPPPMDAETQAKCQAAAERRWALEDSAAERRKAGT